MWLSSGKGARYNTDVDPKNRSKVSRGVLEGEPEPSHKPGITREQLLEDAESDPAGAEEFVALLHELRRQRAAASQDHPD